MAITLPSQAHAMMEDEDNAVALHRLNSMASDFWSAVHQTAGEDCRQFPALKWAVGAIDEAISDLQSDVEGLLKDVDPHNRHAEVARLKTPGSPATRIPS